MPYIVFMQKYVMINYKNPTQKFKIIQKKKGARITVLNPTEINCLTK